MSQAREVGETFLITLGTRLLPIICRVVDKIMPVVQGLMDWENRTHGIENALNGFINVVGTVISVGTNIVNFFKNNQVAMVALGITLTIVAGIIAGILVSALVGWAIAAWSAAIGMIALLWPFMLIGAAIALLIVCIILLVQHWSQVVAFLGGIWSAFASWFGGIMS